LNLCDAASYKFFENFPAWVAPKDAGIYPGRPSSLFDDSIGICQSLPSFVVEPSFVETKMRLRKRASVTVKSENTHRIDRDECRWGVPKRSFEVDLNG
jgi:hypothetical protein